MQRRWSQTLRQAATTGMRRHGDFSTDGIVLDCVLSAPLAANRLVLGRKPLRASEKTYFELQVYWTTNVVLVGIAQSSSVPGSDTEAYPGKDANSYGYFSNDGQKYTNGSGSAYGSAWGSSPAVIGVAFDGATNKLWFRLNGVWQASGDPAAGTGQAFTAAAGTYYPGYSGRGANQDWCRLRTRASEFSAYAPSGFSAPEVAATVTVTVRDESGSLLASTEFDWAFFEEATPDALAVPQATGTTSSNGAGVLTISIPATYLRNGETGSLLISTTGGTAGVQCRSWYMPVTVTV